MASGFSVFTAFKALDKTSKVLKAIGNNAKATAAGMKGRFKSMSAAAVRSFKNASIKMSAVLNKLERKTSIFGQRFKKAFSAGLLIVGLSSFILVGQQAITTAIEFEQTVVNAAAKFPGAVRPGTAEFEKLEKAARDVGAATEFTATQSAGALEKMALAGFTVKASIAALPLVVDLATAANVDLARASDIATDTLGSMGLATKDAAQLSLNLARVNDVLAKTSITSNTDMEQLFETIVKGGPVATSAGASLETYAALAGKLANAGLKGADAGTSLKNIFLSLTAVTPIAAKTLKNLGVATKDSRGNMLDVVDILDDLNKSTGKLGTAEKAGALKNIFGRIPIAAVNILLKEGGESLRSYVKELQNAEGTSKTLAAVMRDTTGGALASLKSAFEGLGITIFKQIQPGFKATIQGITNVVRGINGFIDQNPMLIKTVIIIGKIAAPMLAAAAAIGIVNVALGIMAAIVSANPIGIIIIAITGIIALLITFRKEIFAIGKLVFAVLVSPFIVLFKLLGAITGKKIFKDLAAGGTGFLQAQIEGASETFNGGEGKQLASPQAAMTKQIIEENRKSETTNKLLIQDETGRARMGENGAPGVMKLVPRTASFDDGALS